MRDVAVIALCALVIRQIYRPDEDLVRWGGRVDDPAAGPFDRAPDAPPGWLPGGLRPPGQRRPAVEVADDETESAPAVARS
jgi:uncharacterized membrane protein